MTVKELCAALFYSPATVRRDLAALEAKGMLKRSFGGAVLTEEYAEKIGADKYAADAMDAVRYAESLEN